MNYNRIREEAVRRQRELKERLSQIFDQQASLQREKDQVSRELATVEQMLEAVDLLKADTPLAGEPSGIADQIRRTLQRTTTHLLPTQLRDLLVAAGVTSTSHKNLLIYVHNVISRLKPFLEAKEINNRTAYRWKRNRDPQRERLQGET